MRITRWLVLLFVLAILDPTSTPAQGIAATKSLIAALEDQWVKAVIGRDAAAFNRLLAPSFVYTEDDRVYTREQLIKEITTSTDTVSAGRNEDLTVRVYGNTAIATGWLIMSGRGANGPFEVRYRYTDTWVKLANRWRVVAAQDYKKP
jgi:ketosteroid isomerase-like protein